MYTWSCRCRSYWARLIQIPVHTNRNTLQSFRAAQISVLAFLEMGPAGFSSGWEWQTWESPKPWESSTCWEPSSLAGWAMFFSTESLISSSSSLITWAESLSKFLQWWSHCWCLSSTRASMLISSALHLMRSIPFPWDSNLRQACSLCKSSSEDLRSLCLPILISCLLRKQSASPVAMPWWDKKLMIFSWVSAASSTISMANQMRRSWGSVGWI